MTPRAGLLLLANIAIGARLVGEPGLADAIAFVYLTFATLHTCRSEDLKSAVRAVRS